jgi:cell division protein FtsB
MKMLKGWASTRNITFIAVILFMGLIGFSFYHQTKSIRGLDEQIKIAKKRVDSLEKRNESIQQNINISEKKRIENNNFIDVVPNDDLQNAIDSAFVE